MTTSSTLDPHCVGFRGQIYDFMGEPDKFYCFFSSKTMYMNVKLTEWSMKKTYISKIGMVIGSKENKIEVGLTENGMYCKFNRTPVNRNGLQECINFPTDIQDKNGKDLNGYMTFNEDEKWCNIKYGFMQTHISWGDYLYEDVYCPHLNQTTHVTEIGVYSKGVSPHGVLGCTARYDKDPELMFSLSPQGRGIIEGDYTDYEISDLFATNFKFNRFKSEPDSDIRFGIGSDSKIFSE